MNATTKQSAMATLYKDTIEELPPNEPEPKGREVQINYFVDSDHARDKITCRSHTGILINKY